jgi:hypothetical protein
MLFPNSDEGCHRDPPHLLAWNASAREEKLAPLAPRRDNVGVNPGVTAGRSAHSYDTMRHG